MKVALALSILAAGLALAVDNPNPGGDTKIKSLQMELIATLKDAADSAAAAHANARMTPIEAAQYKRQLLDATLETKEVGDERIAVLGSIVELQKEIELIAQASQSSARMSYMELLNYKAARIKAEIALEKAKLLIAK